MTQKVYEITSIHTNNFTDVDVMKKFTELWQTTILQGHGLSVLYGVYHDYASNYQGDYTCSTATETPNIGKVIELPDTPYQVFKTNRLELPQTWVKIWQLEESGELNRAYQIDFEKYLLDGTVEIHIGIKNKHS